MKKLITIILFSLFIINNSYSANVPKVQGQVIKQNGRINFWGAERFYSVYWDYKKEGENTTWTLWCLDPGNSRCSKGHSTSKQSIFDNDKVTELLNDLIDQIDRLILNGTIEGTKSEKYVIIDENGISHLLAFNFNWKDCNQENGDGVINYEIIEIENLF